VNVGAADMPIGCARTFWFVFFGPFFWLWRPDKKQTNKAAQADASPATAHRTAAHFPLTRLMNATKIYKAGILQGRLTLEFYKVA
jgi:hypothetical protein